VKRLYVDEHRCEGSQLCVASCPEVFGFGQDGLAYVKDQHLASSIKGEDLENLMTLCPTDAIRQEDVP
jgi:ferredoxin